MSALRVARGTALPIDGETNLETGAAGDRERLVRRVAAIGATALAAAVCASAWIAAGAAHGHYLLELPNSADPGWITGPLRGLGVSLGPSGLSAAVAVLTVAYGVALACSRSVGLRFALAAVALANLAFTLGPTIVSSDVFGYVAYAREAAMHGLNPYISPPRAIPHDGILQFVYWKGQPSPYGPLFTILSLPLGLTTTAIALWSYKVAAGAASIALAVLAATIAERRGLNPSRAAIFVGLNPILLLYAVSGAHNDLLAAVLVAEAFALVLQGREAAAAAAAVAALAIKVTLGLALPFVLLAARRRGAAVRGAALALAAIGGPTLILFGPHVLDQVHRIAAERVFDTKFSGPDRLATLLGTPINTAVRVASTAAAALTGVWMIVRAARGVDPIACAGWAFLALAASIASLAPWYLVWLLPLAAVSRNRLLQAATLLATAYLIAVHLPALGGQPWLSPAGS